MLLKLLVLSAAVALAVILWSIFKPVARKKLEKKNLEKKNWEEGLNDLTLPELKDKLAEIEELKRETSTGFVHMNRLQQKKVQAHIIKLNEMSEALKEKIAGRRIGIQRK